MAGHKDKGKGNGKGLDSLVIAPAAYMSQTRDQQRFTISEAAADWHEPMVPQRIIKYSRSIYYIWHYVGIHCPR